MEVTRDQLRSALDEALTAAWRHAEEQGVSPSGPVFSRYAALDDGNVALEAGVQLPRAVAGIGGVVAGSLPGCDAAVALHTGPYSQLWAVYEDIRAWMHENKRVPDGEPWELYLTDPRHELDSAKWETEVVWPLRPIEP